MKTSVHFLIDLSQSEYGTKAIKDYTDEIEQPKQIPFIHFTDEGIENKLGNL